MATWWWGWGAPGVTMAHVEVGVGEVFGGVEGKGGSTPH